MKIRTLFSAVATIAFMALSGCGGGGSTASPGTGTNSVTFSGVAAKGPINGGDVKVYGIKNGQLDTSTVLGTGKTTTDGSGSYTVTLASPPAGPVVVEVSGGTYTDEASGTAGVVLKTPLRAVVSSVADGAKIAVTPLTHLAFEQVDGIGAYTAVEIDDANAQIARFFKITDIIQSLPFDSTKDVPSGSSNDQKLYSAALGAFSQLVNDDRAKRGNTQSLDDSLGTLLLAFETELETNGGLTQATLATINDAIANFEKSGKNKTGVIPAPIVFNSGVLQLITEGTLPPNTIINGIDCTITLPVGVTVKADPTTGETLAGVVTPASMAASNSFVGGNYDKTTGTLHIAILNVQPGFGIGEFAHIEFDGYPSGSTTFSVKVNRIDGGSGVASAPLSGISIRNTFAGL